MSYAALRADMLGRLVKGDIPYVTEDKQEIELLETLARTGLAKRLPDKGGITQWSPTSRTDAVFQTVKHLAGAGAISGGR